MKPSTEPLHSQLNSLRHKVDKELSFLSQIPNEEMPLKVRAALYKRKIRLLNAIDLILEEIQLRI